MLHDDDRNRKYEAAINDVRYTYRELQGKVGGHFDHARVLILYLESQRCSQKRADPTLFHLSGRSKAIAKQ